MGSTDRDQPTITPVGEDAVLVEFAAEISPAINRRVRELAFALENDPPGGVLEVVPAYRSLMVYFDPDAADLERLQSTIERRARHQGQAKLPAPRLYRIPTVYGGADGPDLDRVAITVGLPAQEVVRRFAAGRYPVYCLGFLCGLAYLGGVPEPLRLPRLATPRPLVPAGSVGFAAGQAVVLPIDQPSGWHYIGRTFVAVYDPRRLPPTPIRPGDLVEFPAVAEAEARQWLGQFLTECLHESPAGH